MYLQDVSAVCTVLYFPLLQLTFNAKQRSQIFSVTQKKTNLIEITLSLTLPRKALIKKKKMLADLPLMMIRVYYKVNTFSSAPTGDRCCMVCGFYCFTLPEKKKKTGGGELRYGDWH